MAEHSTENGAKFQIDRTWTIDCFRCSYQGVSYAKDEAQARRDFYRDHWTVNDDGYQMCHLCSPSIPPGKENPQ